jgi:O-antigen ligase
MKKYLNINLEKLAFILLAGYVFILPIAHTTTIREIFFFSLLFITLFHFFIKKEKTNIPLLKPWIIYLLVSVFSLFYAIDKIYSFNEIKNEIIYSLIIIWIISSWIKKEEDFKWLVKILIIGNIFLVSASLIDVIIQLIKSNELPMQTAPFKIGVGKFSSYIILIVPFIFVQAIFYLKNNLNKAFLLFFLLILNFFALYLTANRMAWFALFAQLILIIYLLNRYKVFHSTKKSIFFIFIVLLILIIVFNFITMHNRANNFISEHNNFNYERVINKIQNSLFDDPRIKIWKVAINNIKENPLGGGGFGREAFKLLNPEFTKIQPFGWHAHNMFLNKGVQMGIPGIVGFIILFIMVIKEIYHTCNKIKDNKELIIYPVAGIVMIAGVIIKNLTDDFFVRDHAWLFWLIVAGIIKAFGKIEQ